VWEPGPKILREHTDTSKNYLPAIILRAPVKITAQLRSTLTRVPELALGGEGDGRDQFVVRSCRFSSAFVQTQQKVSRPSYTKFPLMTYYNITSS
jgi:hypothetical protein